MSVGVLIAADRSSPNVIDDAVEKARSAHAAGVRRLWFGQQLDYDAIALAGLIGSAVPGVAVGTSVVPINPRHPLTVAAAAQTAQAASHGHFSLGLGLGVPFIELSVFGIPATHTLQRLREYLTVLRAINDERTRGPIAATRLKTYLDAGATELVLLPLQTSADDLKRVWEVAAAF